MRTSVGGDVIGGGWSGSGAGAWWGIWIFAFLIIFLIVLVFLRGRHHDGHEGIGLGGLAGLLPLLGMGKFPKCDEDLRVEQARDTGRIIHDMDKNAQYLESKVDRNLIEAANDKLRSLEIQHAEERAKWLQERTENALLRSEAKTAQGFEKINHRLDHIPTAPKYFAYGAPESFGYEGFPYRGEGRGRGHKYCDD